MTESLETLAAAVNELARLSHKKGQRRRTELIRSLGAACDALNKVLEDEAAIAAVQAHRILDRSAVADLLENIRRFNGQFVSREGAALQGAGIDDRTKALLLKQATYFRTRASKGSVKPSTPSMREIEEARDTICGLAAALRADDENGTALREGRKQLHRVLYVSGGVLTVLVNAGIAATNPAVATISAFVGGDLVSRGRR